MTEILLKRYPTVGHYPTTHILEGEPVQTVVCLHCHATVTLGSHQRLIAHNGPNHGDPACEGSHRYYWHLFGQRMKDEQ